MPPVHFTNLLIVTGVALAAPLALGFFPRLRLPAIVLEIVLGIVIGPSGLGWVRADLPVSILALVGLAFLLFLAGLEVDVDRLRGRILSVTAIAFAASVAIAIVVGLGLQAGGFVKSPLFVAIVLVATSLGVIVPVLKDSGNISSTFGQLIIAAASIADFGAIILLSLFFSGEGSTDTAGTLILLGVFGAAVVLTGLAVAGVEHSMGLSRVLLRLQDTTAQIRVRAAIVLLIGFVALAENVGLETILGAFAAGALLSLIDRDEAMTHPQFRLKLEAIGFGVFIPVFFVTSGIRFDLNALFSSASTVARVPLFLLALFIVRALPAALYVRLVGRSKAVIAGLLQATSLPFIVAATQIGVQIGIVTRASAAGLIAAGLLSVVIFPALGLSLLRRNEPELAGRDLPAAPVMPVITAEDRALCRTAIPDTGMKTPLAALALALAGCGSVTAHRGDPVPPTMNRDSPPPPSGESRFMPIRDVVRTPPVAVKVAPTRYGRALVDSKGFALYVFTRDGAHRTSTCTGACAAAWPPYIIHGRRHTAGAGADTRQLGTTRRPDGRLQLTYDGHPLYYYVGDKRPGDVLCQAVAEFGGTWFLVDRKGQAITRTS